MEVMVIPQGNNKIESNKLVVKHNKLIEFKGKLTINELKLLNLIIVEIRGDQNTQFKEYEIDVSILRQATEHKDFYNYMKEVATRLEDRKIIVEGINKENKRYFTTIRLIHKPRFIEGSDKLKINIDKDLVPYIIDLKKEFTRYKIENILELRSSYAVRIYELLKQYENIGKREILVEDLREFLGIEDDEYQRFYDFERRILKVAEEEINEYTDIEISYGKIKKGRRVNSILFIVEAKEVDEYKTFIEETYNIKNIKIGSGLQDENFNSKQIIDIYEVAVYKLGDLLEDEKDICSYININYKAMLEKKNVRNNFAYLMNMLENDRANAYTIIKLYKESKEQ